MKVKVGDTVYDGKKVPVMVILNKEDKELIGLMPPGENKYCEYPDNYTEEEVKKWMDEVDE